MEVEDESGSSHIYVIDMSGQAFKIGVAKEPRKRLSEIQVASPFRMTLAGCIELPARHAHSVEKSLHKRYGDHWLRGEWFSFPEGRDLKYIVEDVLGCVPLLARCAQVREEIHGNET